MSLTTQQLGLELQRLSGELSRLSSDFNQQQSAQEGGTGLSRHLQQIYADAVLNNVEFQGLRDKADEVFDQVIGKYPDIHELAAVQQLADQLVETMQRGILAVRKTKPNAESKDQLREGLAYQVAYIKANLDRFTQAV